MDDDFDKDKCTWGKLLGKGSYGEVYEVECKGKKYAGKKISISKVVFEGLQTALQNEIDILERMSKCDNSVKFYAHYTENNYEIIILELCDCELEKILNDSAGGFSSSEILSIMKGLNNAFKIMNMNNILHRDIKLENIMVKYIDSSHKRFIPKINDYGLSKQVKGGITSTICGTPIFMAPELILKQPYNSKCDLWSIGVMIYIMIFKDIPFHIKADIFYLSEDDIKKIFSVRKKKASDPLLEDLISKLLVYDPQKRLSWDEYLNHHFFNQGRNLDIQFENFSLYNKNSVIKVYDYILEQMVIESFERKDRNEVEFSKYSQNFISIDECLKSKNDEFFILGVLGQYLEHIGISVIIEKNETKKSIEDYEYDKNIIQFICNSYIWRHKYLFDFILNDMRTNQLIQDELQRCQFNEKLKKALMKAFNLNDEELIITNYKRDKQSYRAVIVFKSMFNKDITRKDLLNIFKNDNDLKTLKYIEKCLIIPSIKLSKSMLYPDGNNKDDNQWGKNDTRGGEIYNPPIGWAKFGLNVSKRFDNKNDDWLGFEHQKGEWCIAYCPFSGINKNIPQTYENDNDLKHSGKKVGVGLYCPSVPSLMEERTEAININGKNYKIGFMVRVKPDKIRSPQSKPQMWVTNGNDSEVRPYGILVKKV